MFKKILIANRGEIACRVIKTVKRLGIGTVAVYSPQDSHALHVQQADEAYQLGGILPPENYLNISKIIEAAQATGAEAIHPGYGFLSENAQFAQACTDARITLIGPSVQAMQSMGDKQHAKDIAKTAGIPLLPSFYSDQPSETIWLQEAKKIGYPILIKPVAGGGGKGMHMAENEKSFLELLAVARREAKASFGDDRLLIEKFLTHPQHIEVQIFGDNHGHLVHLFERNCSIQRRHQKIIEESPANLPEAVREKIYQAAISCGKAIAYTGAGTVEFLMDENFQFYFMEMNTRLQVEHPVTEMITGLDLVEWQVRVAAGETLPLTQKEIVQKVHAIEARIYAENPKENFLPAPGMLLHLKAPPETSNLRIDSGVASGDNIHMYYDPLLAKLIAVAPTRAEAIKTLSVALKQYEIVGVETNLSFLQHVLQHKDYEAGTTHTKWVEEHCADLTTSNTFPILFWIWAAVAHLLKAESIFYSEKEPNSPWRTLPGWTITGEPRRQWIKLQNKTTTHLVSVEFLENKQFRLTLGDKHFLASGSFLNETHLKVQVDEYSSKIIALLQDNIWRIAFEGEQAVFEAAKGETLTLTHDTGESVIAPMSSRVVSVLTAPGKTVKKGEKLVLLESMKMEHALCAPFDGVVKSIDCVIGGLVEEGATLVEFEER